MAQQPVYQHVVDHIQSIFNSGELGQLKADFKPSDKDSTPPSLTLLSMEEWGVVIQTDMLLTAYVQNSSGPWLIMGTRADRSGFAGGPLQSGSTDTSLGL
ncbi:hypothetical protein GYMLUDRAFT_248087 [Collybiopsis luxurians FD-317 M1]|uniref:Uncharacterized protein n=1 Tax=Collybiopsis luxurians FD-317 M1 TaxID=944289 RepID=A0A0D0BMI5_9AGAR|nr:hypothetical protein GYMLUDRAFT_248087 [Collybiopsis luxurians FD-317 M1]